MSEPVEDLGRRLRQTRADVDSLYELTDAGFRETRARFARLEGRIGQLEDQLTSEMRTVHATLAAILERLPPPPADTG